MTITHHLTFTRTALATLLAATLTAGISGCSSDDSASTSTAIDGSVFAAPVNGASCEIQDSSGNVIVDTFTTSASGNYHINIPNAQLANDLVLVCDGGSYSDEATTTSTTAGTMTAYAAAETLSAGSSFSATPGSTIVEQLVSQYGMTLDAAQTAFNAAFGYTPDVTITPTDVTTAPGEDATDEQLLAGLRAAAFSQLTADLGLTAAQQFELLAALAQDLSDGTLDGEDSTGVVSLIPADIQNQFATALLNFHTSDKNATGLTSDKIGKLPFAKLALTNTYQVEYIAGMMPAAQGKTQFKIKVTDTNGAVTGQAVSLMPVMHMAEHSHSTPVDGDCMEEGAGIYACTVYYLMADSMAGVSTGYWDLKVMIGDMNADGEAAHFYPSVGMAMGGTARANLKHSSDTITNMMGTEVRTHMLFKSSLSSDMDGHTFEIFTAAKESMMSFPATTNTVVLNTGTADEMTIAGMSIEVSTDPTFPASAATVTATEDGAGYWTATGITGLTAGVAGEIYVRMTISDGTNNNVYNNSIDGVAAEGVNDYATFTFTVTPPAAPMAKIVF